ncbi:GNAT family N-acetyltransferase [Parashewanella tropica]|uniref:GNAT family N-acetyltransferase n=1 Tax=Parashewanella tropica TaxID=2547970 RepID=UPI0010596CC5|nr:GNAT family N-acetyltransferase [Parashewanella tropica]
MIYLETDNLTLRSLVDSDWSNFYEMNSSEEICRFIRPPEPAAQIREVFDQRKKTWNYELNEWLALVLEDRQGNFVGYSGFRRIDKEYNDVEVGYMLRPSAQGKGFATEALKRVVEWGITEYGIRKFIGYCDIENIGSQRVMQKTGFKQEGVLREHVKNGERWVDDCVFGLLSREF